MDEKIRCPFCGFEAPRDYNSAIYIKKLMLFKIVRIGQGLPKSTLVKMEALPNNWQLLSMKQEIPCNKQE